MYKKSSNCFLKDQHTPLFKTLNKNEQLDLEKHCMILKIQRITFTKEILTNLKKVDTDVHELKEAISLDIQNVGLQKEISDYLDKNDNFFNFKHKDLFDKEKLLSNELKQIEQDVLDVNIGKSNWSKTFQTKPLETYHINLPESMRLFDEFLLKSKGHTASWRPEDHQLFLHLKSRHPPEQVAEILHSKLPDISIDQVLEHNSWHEKYTKLLQNKKKTVEEWKTSKKMGRSRSVGSISEIVRADTPSSNSRCGDKTFRKSNEEVKKQIAEWKIAKFERLVEQHKLKRQEEEKILAIDRQRKKMKMMEKQKVADYLSSKMQIQLQKKEENDILREEKKDKARKANILVQVYRKQDEKRLQEKLELKKHFTLARLETENRLRQVKCEVNVRRDPQRVQKSTIGWMNKVAKEAEDKMETTRDKVFITQVPHLKVPDWRQDVKFPDQIIL